MNILFFSKRLRGLVEPLPDLKSVESKISKSVVYVDLDSGDFLNFRYDKLDFNLSKLGLTVDKLKELLASQPTNNRDKIEEYIFRIAVAPIILLEDIYNHIKYFVEDRYIKLRDLTIDFLIERDYTIDNSIYSSSERNLFTLSKTLMVRLLQIPIMNKHFKDTVNKMKTLYKSMSGNIRVNIARKYNYLSGDLIKILYKDGSSIIGLADNKVGVTSYKLIPSNLDGVPIPDLPRLVIDNLEQIETISVLKKAFDLKNDSKIS